MSSPHPRPEPSVTSRRALLLGSAALPLASCGLLGSRGTSGRSDDATSGEGGSDGQGASGSASDGGGNGSAPRVTTEGWATLDDLESTPPDLAAADRRYGTTRGQMERKDPYGSWISPGFPTDGEVLNPTVQVDGVDSFTDEQVKGIGASVLVHTIVTILDSPLAFEKDNARATEVSPELVKGFHLEGIEPHAFDAVFTEQLLLSGTADPKQSAADRYHVRPKPYEAGRPRLHLLDHGVRIRPAQFDWEGPSIHASARGVIPVTTESGDELFFREASLVLNPGEGKNEGGLVIACSLGAGNPVWLADPAMLPEIPIEAEPPADWTEHTVGSFRARLPHEGAEPVVHDLGVTVRGDDGRTKTSLAQFVLPVGDPYPMPRATAMARATVPGADLVTMGVNKEEDGTALVSVRVHQKGLAHHIQLFRRTLEEAPLLAHQIVAGLRLT